MCMCDLHIQSMCGYKNRTVCVQYSHTILVTKFALCTLYMDPCVVRKKQSILWPFRARKISKSLVALRAGTIQILVARKLI